MKKLMALVAAGTVLLAPAYALAAKGTAYGAGLKIASKRGYSGEQRSCFARVYARHASPGPRGWTAKVGASYRGELWNECRVSR